MFKFISVLFLASSCTIYQSPERRAFESESPSFKVRSLQKFSCSSESIKMQSSQSRLITINDDISMWEHIIQNKSNYESVDITAKEYCLYEISK
jgi:hypothetical protein